MEPQIDVVELLDMIPDDYRTDGSVSHLVFCGYFVDHDGRLKLQLTRICDGATIPFLFDLGEPRVNESTATEVCPSNAVVTAADHQFHIRFISRDSNKIEIDHPV